MIKGPTLRAALHDAIEASQTALEYVDNSFVLREGLKLTADLPDLSTAHVSLFCVGFDESPLTRERATRSLVPVYVYLQKKLSDANNLATGDELLILEEQLMATAKNLDLTGFTWVETSLNKDPSGLPYEFHLLREKSMFEASFTARYEHLSK